MARDGKLGNLSVPLSVQKLQTVLQAKAKEISALRSYEDLLGIDRGGADGHGHLGYAGRGQYETFGSDVFNRD